MSFVHLHVHSEYSLLDGLSPIASIAARAKELNMGAVALTDHGVMYGAIEFDEACHAAGVKPILGMEGYLTKRGRRMQDRDINFDKQPYHLLLLAMDNGGYKNLMRLASLAQLEGFYFKPRVDHPSLEELSAGLICTSGCLAAEIPRLIVAGQHEEAREAVRWYQRIFDDRFYFELQDHDLAECHQVNRVLVDWAKEFSVPLIATNDAHYVRREDAVPHDLMLCIQTAALLGDRDRMRFNNDSYHLAAEAEMRSMFDALAPEAVGNTAAIAERCSVSLKTKAFHLPAFKRPEPFSSDDDYMRWLCAIGFEQRYGIPARADGTWVSTRGEGRGDGGVTVLPVEELERQRGLVYTGEDAPIRITQLSPLALPSADAHPGMTPRRLRERLEFEIDTIISMGFSTYMLIVWDLIRFCREQGIWWDVRGSAAGSMVSHVLMLTNIEPVSNDLYFERFLNPERVTMPDIDMDFPDDQRHLLVDYTIEKYGKDKVAQIITFGTMAARAALKDVGRVMSVPLSEVNKVTALVPAVPGKPVNLTDARQQVPALQELLDSDDMLRDMYERAITVEGRVRNAGTHAAGVVIADKPLIEYVPLNRLTGTPLTAQLNAVTQFEMTHLESIGLLKLDYLGLSMLTIMRRTCGLIEQRHGLRYTLDTIPIHEKVIYDTLSRGDVLGIFQVESAGMKKLMAEMRPKRYENIVAAVALYRPGPMEYISSYNRRLHGEETVQFAHPDVESALGETYGIIVYQEQIMRVARDFAGYSMGEADTIRKAVSKKVKEQLDKHKSKFRDGAIKKGYAGEIADKIWTDIEYFARYGFNKSHAAIYASLTCQTAWLKACYPLEHYTALMTVEAGSADKIASLIADARAHGIEVLPPSINHSLAAFSIQEFAPPRQPAVRFGLVAIKNVGSGPVDSILKARGAIDDQGRPTPELDRPFASLDDMCRRVDMTQFNKRALESLIKVGALDEFGSRPQLLAVMDAMIGLASAERRAAEKGQGMLFGLLQADDAGAPPMSMIELPRNYRDVPRREMLSWERELVGTYVSEHPLTAAMAQLHDVVSHSASQLTEEVNGQNIVVAGVVQLVRPHVSKSGKSMAFAQIEDITGPIELTIFPRTWERCKELMQPDRLVIVYGKAEVQEGRGAKMLVDRVTDTVDIARVADLQPTLALPDQPDANVPATPDWDTETSPVAMDDPVEPDGFWYTEPAVAAPAPSAPPPPAAPPPKAVVEQPATNGHRPAVIAAVPVVRDPPPAPAAKPSVVPAADPSTATLLIVIQRCGNAKADIERLQAVHSTLVLFGGEQRFSIKLRNGGTRDQVIDFPNDTTRDCDELRAALRAIGAECA